MGVPKDATLVIKHTFLEYVGSDIASLGSSKGARQRSQTEPDICQAEKLCYGEVRELLHGGSSSSSSSHLDDTCDGELDAARAALQPMLVLPTPEPSPVLCHMPQEILQWQQREWVEDVLPQAVLDPEAMCNYGQWNDQYATGDSMWAPCPFAVSEALQREGYSLPAAGTCDDFQPVAEQIYPPSSACPFAVSEALRNEGYRPPSGITRTNSQPIAEQYCPPRNHIFRQQPQVAVNARFDAISSQAEAAAAAALAGESSAEKETRTTVMLRDLPEDYSRNLLLQLLDSQGFSGCFDFVYLPVDFKHRKILGYALINMVTPWDAIRLRRNFECFSNWGMASGRASSVTWCSPQQGLKAHVERYRNSPVMHESVPEEWRPLLLSRGVPLKFPPPTHPISAPKVKGIGGQSAMCIPASHREELKSKCRRPRG